MEKKFVPPLITWKGILVDGYIRYDICKELGIPFECEEMEFDSIEEAKFRGIVRPADTLEMPLEILRLGRISKIYAEAYVGGKLCAQAILNFILGEQHV